MFHLNVGDDNDDG